MFRVRKWYLDCVTDSGIVFIGYATTLRWRSFVVSYSSRLISHPDGKLEEATAWRADNLPTMAGDDINWRNSQLDIEGTWRARAPAVRRTLLKTSRGSVKWLAHQPASAVRVQVGESLFEGRGYAEELRLSIPPWRLPIDELLWGRYVGPQHSFTWIVWKGAHPLRLAVHNGRVTSKLKVIVAEVRAPGIRLELSAGRTIRANALDQILRRVPLVGDALARKFGATFEHKLLSRGTIMLPGAAHETGWVIHEAVKWNVPRRA